MTILVDHLRNPITHLHALTLTALNLLELCNWWLLHDVVNLELQRELI
jgi:hypothetical protein